MLAGSADIADNPRSFRAVFGWWVMPSHWFDGMFRGGFGYSPGWKTNLV